MCVRQSRVCQSFKSQLETHCHTEFGEELEKLRLARRSAATESRWARQRQAGPGNHDSDASVLAEAKKEEQKRRIGGTSFQVPAESAPPGLVTPLRLH